MDNEGSEAKWTQCVAFYIEEMSPPSPLTSPRENQRGKGPKHFIFSQKISSKRSVWVPKNPGFYADSKFEDKVDQKCTQKSYSQIAFFACFYI